MKLDPLRVAARQALFNWLKLFHDPSAPVTAEMLENAAAHLLNFSYWQANAKLLGETIATDLATWPAISAVPWRIEDLALPHVRQHILLQQREDFSGLVAQTESPAPESGEVLRLLPLAEGQILALRQTRTGGLRVRQYNPIALIRQAQLRLLPPVVDLTYSASLELFPHQAQLVEGPMQLMARFQLSDDGCQGVMSRGHLVQKYETFTHGQLAQHHELLYAIKRIEKHFINPHTDSHYRDLVHSLEKMLRLVQLGAPEAWRSARATLQRGLAAKKALYENDRKLDLLLRELEFLIVQGPERPQETIHSTELPT